ncbi:hypothetical protein V4P56_05715 [Bartonella sp. B35(2025)]
MVLKSNNAFFKPVIIEIICDILISALIAINLLEAAMLGHKG